MTGEALVPPKGDETVSEEVKIEKIEEFFALVTMYGDREKVLLLADLPVVLPARDKKERQSTIDVLRLAATCLAKEGQREYKLVRFLRAEVIEVFKPKGERDA